MAMLLLSMKLFKVKLKICEQPAYRQTGIFILLDFSSVFLS
jgi:hypothetical protein